MNKYKVKTNYWAISFVVFFTALAVVLLVLGVYEWGIASVAVALCILPNVVHYWKLTDDSLMGYNLFVRFFSCRLCDIDVIRINKESGYLNSVVIVYHAPNGSYCSPRRVKHLADLNGFVEGLKSKLPDVKVEVISKGSY